MQEHAALFQVLSHAYPVDFRPYSSGADGSAGVIFLNAKPEQAQTALPPGVNVLVILGCESAGVDAQKGVINFHNSSGVDSCFHGQKMKDEVARGFQRLSPRDGDEIVAELDGVPVWVARKEAQSNISIVGVKPPAFAAGQTIYDVFNRRNWIQLLPLLNFLKTLTRDEDWQRPPLRACLMFDDPNLHAKTYGFVNFHEMARHARDFNYHASFAMVPLDSWFVSKGVAAFFRQHRDRLSLCIHGNNHAKLELGADIGSDEFQKLFAEALRRIESFEKKSGVSVARVMVPPYGALNAAAAAKPMLRLGYEAVCVSRASITSRNRNISWPGVFGHGVGEFVEGFPVIPRQVMADGHEGTFRLAAFLNQPIIPHGHHQDCASGLGLLERTANSINALGHVEWLDMAALAESNYLTRRIDDTLVVRMLTRRASVKIPDGVARLCVQRAWLNDDQQVEHLECAEGAKILQKGMQGCQSHELRVQPGQTIRLHSPPPDVVDYRMEKSPRFKPLAFPRRIACEMRDRLSPLISHH